MKYLFQLSGIVAGFSLAAGAQAADPPNVLFIALDDLRPEINALGAAHMHTPNMDRLVDTGRAFTRHYVAVPTCGASRHALLTGSRPTTFEDTTNAAFDQFPTSMPASPESVADLLRRYGWHTVSIGKISHESDSFRWNDTAPSTEPDNRIEAENAECRFSWDEIVTGHNTFGFRDNPIFAYADGSTRDPGVSPAYEIGVDAFGNSVPDDAYPDGRVAMDAVDKLEEFSETGQRFFMAVGFYKPHLPFNAPKAYWDLYDRGSLPAPEPASAPSGADPDTVVQSGEPSGRYAEKFEDGSPASFNDSEYRKLLRHGYYASVSYADAQVGKVLDALEATGLDENTVIILWGDHGWCLDDYGLVGKHNVLERGVHAPLVIRIPGQPEPGIPNAGIVETVDIYATIADLCGLTPPDSVDGVSLRPMIQNPDAPGKGWAYSRQLNTLGQDAVRTDRWRLIRDGSNYDLYDLEAFPFELSDVSSSETAVVNDIVTTKLNVVPSRIPGLSYDNFVSAYFSPQEISDGFITGRTIDADGDGSLNVIEALAGTSPLDPADFPEREQDFVDFGGERAVRFVVDSRYDDIFFQFQQSSSLQTWSPYDRVLDSEILPDGRERLTVGFQPESSPNSRRFIRQSVDWSTLESTIVEETFDGDTSSGLAAALLGNSAISLAPGQGRDGTDGIRCTYTPSSQGSERVIVEYTFPNGLQLASATLSFDVRFDADFEFVLGGKMHGLAPKDKITGGAPRVADGWSARIMWRPEGRAQTYLYGQDESETFGGGNTTTEPVFQKGVWHRVELQVRLNDAGQANGWSRILLDGIPVVDTRDYEFRGVDTPDSLIQKFLFSTFHGGSNSSWSPSQIVHANFDNFRIVEGFPNRAF